MFGEIFRFEVAHQLRRRATWLQFALVLGLFVLLTVATSFPGARSSGYFFNAPFAIASACIFGAFIGVVVTAGIAGDAAARDVQTRLAPLMYTTPVGKAAYLGGRFLGAFTVSALLLLAIPLAQALALLQPGLEPELIAPVTLASYALPYFILLVPTAFATCALLFSAAVLARRAMAAYVGAAFLGIAALFTNAFVAQIKGMWGLAKLLDPFPVSVMSELSGSLTPAQKNTWVLATDPSTLANRAVWIGVGCVVLAFAFARFAFGHEAEAGRRPWPWRARKADAAAAVAPDFADASRVEMLAPLPRAIAQRFDTRARLLQLRAATARAFGDIARSRGVYAVLAIALVVALTGPELMEHMGVPIVPVTGYIAQVLSGADDFFGFVAPLLCVFYAGELVWRERDAGIAALVDAAPVPDWLPLLGKGLGLGLALAAWQGLLMLAGITTQLLMGHHDLQPLLWLQILFGLGLPKFLLFGVLAIAVHVLVNQKFLGHLLALAAYAVMLFGPKFGLEHHLLRYATSPDWTFSDIAGFRGGLMPWAWFTLYWAGWALLLAMGTRLLWVRGVEGGTGARWRMAKARVTRPVLALASVAALVIVGAGGFIFYNTNVLNTYASESQLDQQRVDYERKYARYADLPQPTLAATKLDVELYPDQSRATVVGTHTFVNRTAKPIATLHVETSADVDTTALAFDRPARVVSDDAVLRHRIVQLATPLQPGEALDLAFTLSYGGHGFSHAGAHDAIAPRVSHFEEDWMPLLGYQRSREVNDSGARHKLGLPAKPEIPPLTDTAAINDLRGVERIQVDTTVGTVAGQTAVAPGRLRGEWSTGGRRHFHYITDQGMRGGYAIYSARYALYRTRWRDVPITVYYHPTHALNVARMARASQASLDDYTRRFGPYPARQLSLVESAAFEIGAHAHPTSIQYFEAFALMNPAADTRGIDFVSAVIGHELAHQWWGNQVTPASVAGAPFVAESLAWYSAYGVIARTAGPASLAALMDLFRESYLGPRARDGVPLLESADQFTGYRLGPFSLVALREAIGDAAVDRGLRNFFVRFKDGGAPLPTSLDLYAALREQTPPARRVLLADLLARNTFWDLRTRAASATRVGPAADDLWRVTLDLHVSKVSVDRKGAETPRPLVEPIELGVYAPYGPNDEPGKLLYLRKHRLRVGEQRVVLLVHGQPGRAGIDPRAVYIDTVQQNNVRAVVASGGTSTGASTGAGTTPGGP
jgi:ABC-type transport system involved in multi-copper enzyme maturation permease subunit